MSAARRARKGGGGVALRAGAPIPQIRDVGSEFVGKGPSSAAEPVQALENPVREAVVTRLTTNLQVMVATVGEMEEQRVLVRSTEMFVPGMKIRVEHRAGDLWEHVGPLPRFRGRY